jgi:hypothetical protein
MKVLIENKWVLLISPELLAWSSTFLLLYAWYGLKSIFWFKVAALLFTITVVIPHVLLGIVNFVLNRKVDKYHNHCSSLLYMDLQ